MAELTPITAAELAANEESVKSVGREGVALQGVYHRSFAGLHLSGRAIEEAEIAESDFTGMTAAGAGLNHMVVIDSTIARGWAAETSLYKSTLARCRIEDYRFENCQMIKLEMSDCHIERVAFVGCNLLKASFYGSTLVDVTFERCAMSLTRWRRATLDRVDIVEPTHVDNFEESLSGAEVLGLGPSGRDPLEVLLSPVLPEGERPRSPRARHHRDRRR